MPWCPRSGPGSCPGARRRRVGDRAAAVVVVVDPRPAGRSWRLTMDGGIGSENLLCEGCSTVTLALTCHNRILGQRQARQARSLPWLLRPPKTSLQQRLNTRARERWPQLAQLDVRFKGAFAYVTRHHQRRGQARHEQAARIRRTRAARVASRLRPPRWSGRLGTQPRGVALLAVYRDPCIMAKGEVRIMPQRSARRRSLISACASLRSIPSQADGTRFCAGGQRFHAKAYAGMVCGHMDQGRP